MTNRFLRHRMSIRDVGSALLLMAAAFVAGPAQATVDLRVEARPIGDPLQAFVTVTSGTPPAPVTGLTAADFTVTLDGVSVPIAQSDLTLPPSQDSNQKVSVVFAMDYTSSVLADHRAAMEGAVSDFIDAMNIGDFAAILKFNNDSGAVVVQTFIEIDDGLANDLQLKAAVAADFPGDGSNILDATQRAVEEFAALPSLPAGPKAVILVTDGIDTHSTSTEGEVIGVANDNSIPIFTVGVGNPDQDAIDLMINLGVQTGGDFIPAPDDQAIADAYASISFLLTSEYLITIPSTISDCAAHTLVVAVAGQTTSASATFTRRECDVTPNAFSFTNQTGVALNTAITSNTVTITGIEAPVAISIAIGSYSIGCTSNFTFDPGTISDGQTVCIRQTSSQSFSTSRVSTLTVGGVSATFTTTTSAAPPPGGGGGGGGGGSTGVVEVLLGLAALFARQRRRA